MTVTGDQCALAVQTIPVLLLALVVELRLIGADKAGLGVRTTVAAFFVAGLAGFHLSFWAPVGGVEGVTGYFVILGVFGPLGAVFVSMFPLVELWQAGYARVRTRR